MLFNAFQGLTNKAASLSYCIMERRFVSFTGLREMSSRVHSGAKKRFKVLKDGTVLFPHCNRRHMQSRKTHKQSARGQQYGVLTGGMARKIRRLLKR
ncbi:uncharacterized protein Gasu_17140 [Galdieria sulphuraria]|uniref:50S ribosomal protein L35 n=1 Tax=Galdieria sulphuraria TaxID=130081 RepID=M2XLB1_GALSU|nr:uncharacterized protein Gasu_17140 [Galdieria sulphuraria]EME30947.1 hypothetical protein Gasu_17140 [Galdieria sulphuraria]|eukprot:XP_005707467.1 hypothetical protein Gasu_17140 [Galdieria sulphuraria]